MPAALRVLARSALSEAVTVTDPAAWPAGIFTTADAERAALTSPSEKTPLMTEAPGAENRSVAWWATACDALTRAVAVTAAPGAALAAENDRRTLRDGVRWYGGAEFGGAGLTGGEDAGGGSLGGSLGSLGVLGVLVLPDGSGAGSSPAVGDESASAVAGVATAPSVMTVAAPIATKTGRAFDPDSTPAPPRPSPYAFGNRAYPRRSGPCEHGTDRWINHGAQPYQQVRNSPRALSPGLAE
ncbi:hypothetical protein GCM10023191_000120 [Actinoallomurus oryzae]|uniref:Uncharacterized protein n=1 Tax=Actinoallomurus oryzae TaxID=502180 RepID=A0ABP8P646_9ACTN